MANMTPDAMANLFQQISKAHQQQQRIAANINAGYASLSPSPERPPVPTCPNLSQPVSTCPNLSQRRAPSPGLNAPSNLNPSQGGAGEGGGGGGGKGAGRPAAAGGDGGSDGLVHTALLTPQQKAAIMMQVGMEIGFGGQSP